MLLCPIGMFCWMVPLMFCIVWLLSWMLWCPIGMYCWIVPVYWFLVWQCVPLTPGGLFHAATEAIYLTALVVSVLTVIVIILLGVSSRVCCLPADKGKGIADRSWTWRARRLYMWAGCAWISLRLLLFRLILLSLDDKSVEHCGFVTVYELVLFSNWGTPLLNVFINEVDVFQ